MITKRGKQVRAVFILLAIYAGFKITGNVWWVGDHYCWGSMTECLLRGK